MANFIVRPRKAMLGLLLLWLVTSAFYYADNLFSPSFYLGYDEGTLHKVLKYAACLGLSIYFCVAARAYTILLFCTLLLLISSYFFINRGALEIATLSIMVVGTMLPFVLVPALWERKIRLLGQVVVICGGIVGVFSIIELTVLTAHFESAWASTGSIRSISTLFNPNNLGLYAGVCLILLPYMRFRASWTVICGALLMFSFVTSGSRTAWVSLVFVLVYALMTDADTRLKLKKLLRRHLLQLAFTGIAAGCIYIIYQTFGTSTEIEEAHRGTDLYTASIRWENFLTFLGLIDGDIIFPDQLGKRADYIQDSFYLTVLNSFGVLGTLLLLVFFITNFSPRRLKSPDLTPWKLIFVFYMVSGLSGSQLNSFPNNQLFFLSMGALWFYRPEFGSPRMRLNPRPRLQ